MKIKYSLVYMLIVLGVTMFTGCSGAKMLWYTSNGIVTYNRHTGQFEMLWENAGQGCGQSCKDTCNCLCVKDSVKRVR